MTIAEAIRKLFDLISSYPKSKAYTWPTEEELEEMHQALLPLMEEDADDE